ncbi:MAG: Asp23/Gls24 family envelope stress response protein [Candidatus Bipolaricaulaceae bacterium]|nr:Asp23/Gls24 family envelope stress response protein [Candidatus Bipolaricaulota bacterium]MCX7844656.1 Asp23/Gls24 family envelope stress response protein [Candidatus Bipolaricaulota bacterium]MDW8151317.1 Asp23/Gls24 family envelope stress response protein [Candidatus Bipolaricaulota bacterium]
MPEARVEMTLPLGKLRVRPEVLVRIASKAVEQMEGVRLWRPRGLASVFGGEPGVEVQATESGALDVNVRIGVMYGYPVQEVAQGVQQAVREALEGMVGVRVARVNVYVQEVFLPEVEIESGESV